MQTRRATGPAGLLLAAAIVLAGPAAAEPKGSFALISDIHLDPFDPPALAAELATADVAGWPALFATITEQVMSPWGRDTNHALMASSIAAFAAAAASTDFAIVPGDLLAHNFEKTAAGLLGVAEDDPKVRELAIKTAVFVGDSIGRALPGKPVILALGNNDSDCGDYEITPDGSFLAGTKEMVRRLAGPALLAADFDATWAAGGYYAMQHPGLPKTLILVLNDILWSRNYDNACGTDAAAGDAAAEAMMTWLAGNLARQKAAGGAVWLVHHIPWGIDPYSTAHSREAACAAKVVPFFRAPYADGFIALLRQYRDIVQASYSGHVHTDDYRLLIDDAEGVLGLQKIPPAISPIYDQNPAYQVVTYDLATGVPTDFSTTYLANLDKASLAVPGDWRQEYTFTSAYGLPAYSAASVAKMVDGVKAGGAIADTYRRLYMVSHGELPAKDLPAYICAMTRLTPAGFTACYCGG